MATKKQITDLLNGLILHYPVQGIKLNEPGYIDLFAYDERKENVLSVKLDKLHRTLDVRVTLLDPYRERTSTFVHLTRPQVSYVADLLTEHYWPHLVDS